MINKFESRLWKLDLENLWWNDNRSKILTSLMKLNGKKKFRAHLTGGKGAGKSTIIAVLENKIEGAKVFRMLGHPNVSYDSIDSEVLYVIIDEAQKIPEGARQLLMQKHPRVLMTSVQDLTNDGYDIVLEIEDLTVDEVESYAERGISFTNFTRGAIEELTKASMGRPRLINLFCNTALEEHSKITREIIRDVAVKKFKRRY